MTPPVYNLQRLRSARDPAELRAHLEALQAQTDRNALVAGDPLELVHRYHDPHDQEVAGLLVAGLAYGRVETIRARTAEALSRLGPSPAAAVDSDQAGRALEGFGYRFQRGDDLSRYVGAVARIRRKYGSLAAAFRSVWQRDDVDFAETASRFVRELRAQVGGDMSYGVRYLLPDPGTGGAAKRLFLYLRWMIRGPDGLDLGTWKSLAPGLPAASLVIPLDTHIARIARYLDFTRRVGDDLRTAREITAHLAAADPDDPVRFDMALCHLGISGRCPRKQAAERCRVCPMVGICRVGGATVGCDGARNHDADG